MTALKVLHVAPYSEWAWAYGGIPRVLAAQTAGLADLEVATTVLTTDVCDRQNRLERPKDCPKSGTFRLRSDAGSEVVVCPNVSNWLAAHLQLYVPIGMNGFMFDEGVHHHLGHLHACRNLPGVIAGRRMRRAGVPYVVQPNGTAPRIENRRMVKAVFDVIAGRALLRGASGLIAVTEFERRQLENLGLRAPVTVIPNPLDLTEFNVPADPNAFLERWHLGDRPLILYLGQLSSRKRIDLALSALAAVEPARRPNLVIAGGDMGRRHSLETLARDLGIARRVVFTGVLPGRRRLEALAAADVVVYPTRDEIFGLVPLEALLCGSPVVVSDDCGCGEVIDSIGGGLVIEHGSVPALVDAIAAILAEPEQWRKRAEAAADRIRTRFSKSVVAGQLLELYRSLVPGERELQP